MATFVAGFTRIHVEIVPLTCLVFLIHVELRISTLLSRSGFFGQRWVSFPVLASQAAIPKVRNPASSFNDALPKSHPPNQMFPVICSKLLVCAIGLIV
jgi:hypothetical protein